MKRIFLESHHLKNRFFGFGQFNLHLLKALLKIDQQEFRFVIHGSGSKELRKEFGNNFDIEQYYSLRRYPFFRINKKFDLWHSLNQNTRIEPKNKIPYLLTVHNITHVKNKADVSEKEEHKRFQQKLFRSDAITYISEYAKTSTHEFFKVPDVPEYVIYNGNPIKKINLAKDFQPKVSPKKAFLFSIGEFTDRKNFKTLLPMLEQLPEYNLILAGKNSTRTGEAIKKYILEKKLEKRVFLPGKISEEKKQYYYKNCEAFVFPSLREGFGLPVIEAMKFGKPVFTSNNTSLPEIGGNLAFYWDHYEENYMADILKEGLKKFRKNENSYRKELILRAESFNWDEAAKQYFKVYQSLL